MHIHACEHRDALGPHIDVAVGAADPEPVLGHAQHDRIVQQPAILVAQEDITALANLDATDMPRRQQLHEGRRVQPAELDHPLDSHIPQAGPLDRVPVFIDRRIIADRHPHAVIGVELGRARGDGGLEKG